MNKIDEIATLNFETLGKNDIVLVKVPYLTHETIDSVAQFLKPKMNFPSNLIITHKSVDFSIIPEWEMNQMGWYRK